MKSKGQTLPFIFRLLMGLAQDCHISEGQVTNQDLGFPEFESFHLADFSTKAQFSKSAASTIPPRPLRKVITLTSTRSDLASTGKNSCLIPTPSGILCNPLNAMMTNDVVKNLRGYG